MSNVCGRHLQRLYSWWYEKTGLNRTVYAIFLLIIIQLILVTL